MHRHVTTDECANARLGDFHLLPAQIADVDLVLFRHFVSSLREVSGARKVHMLARPEKRPHEQPLL